MRFSWLWVGPNLPCQLRGLTVIPCVKNRLPLSSVYKIQNLLQSTENKISALDFHSVQWNARMLTPILEASTCFSELSLHDCCFDKGATTLLSTASTRLEIIRIGRNVQFARCSLGKAILTLLQQESGRLRLLDLSHCGSLGGDDAVTMAHLLETAQLHQCRIVVG
jgi:hypothetical protein